MHWGYIATTAVAASLLWWKQKKAKENAEIVVISIDVRPGKEPNVIYKDSLGKSHSVYMTKDQCWYTVRRDEKLSNELSKKLTEILNRRMTKVLNKIKPKVDVIMLGAPDDSSDWWKTSKF